MIFRKTVLATTVMLALAACNTSDDDKDSNSPVNKGNSTNEVEQNFNRISSFLVCSQIDSKCDTDVETSAEIVAASTNGRTLIYTDSPAKKVGFVNIADPAQPSGLGTLALEGEPTSVAVSAKHALVGVNTSEDFVNVSGHLVVVDVATQTEVTKLTLDGQPDSVAVSPNGLYAAVVIENERDEDLGDGEPPQLPAGTLNIVKMTGTPDKWEVTSVDLTGIADLFPSDPEPEYVDINNNNIAVITLQENNYIILVDLKNGNIVNHFSAGTVDLEQIDIERQQPGFVSQIDSLTAVPREPDGVAWIDTEHFVTADEGDLDGGSRGFTVFKTDGSVAYSSGNDLEHMTARFGHYPEKRSGKKGNEPENAEVGKFGDEDFLFVNSERSSLVFVYDISNPTEPLFKQVLPAAVGPEGALAIPSRNLLIVASEEDSRGDKMRSALNIYEYSKSDAAYPTIESANRTDGTPIPWGAMSGLSADSTNENILYAVEDSFYQSNRIFSIDVSQAPALLTNEIRIKDDNDVFANFPAVSLADTSVDKDHATRIEVFDEVDLGNMINDDKTVNIDPEGIAKASDNSFWIASEGNGTIDDASRPINSLNFLFKTDVTGIIEEVISLPDSVNSKQLRFGFEGVTEYDGKVYVAFQRVWNGDTNVRIGVYDTLIESWSFLYYPLDDAESQNGGWVGLSDITSLGNGEFLVVERDNQGGPDAAIKRLYQIDVTGLVAGSVVSKTLVRDLMGDLSATGGLTMEKVEGSAVMNNGDVYIINDNDGVDDNSGETQLINLGNIIN